VFRNRVGWASTYLKKAGLIESTRRGAFRITPRGNDLLAQHLSRIDKSVLEQFPEFLEFRRRRTEPQPAGEAKASEPAEDQTPEDALSAAYKQLRREVEAELLEEIGRAAPAFFEQLVVDLVVAMGYGGSRQDAGRSIGRTGDEGIDGIINEDRLGLDVIYLQAKKWQGTVGRPEIQKFAGALQGQRAKKGIFLTTSGFSAEAREYASAIDSRIVLIDGQRLASLMIEHDVGVSRTGVYEIKRVDSDYFSED